ncbi:MAG: tRNA (adenosine(37)-N6)-threonylcarbamoyltransferase complex ATPase subunit type 1 TsaE [Sutterella sp.]|nr:tRNA (adenosine(37)-N6)-threonylcarbamoyltransferase complex ATPase subunit type 1 TsaE [Sutterella sp.]
MDLPENNSQNSTRVRLSDETHTVRFAEHLADALTHVREAICQSGFNLRLTGDLGAGKTTLTRALLRHFGVTGRVKSPTFELVSDYDVLDGIAFHHFDFYRFESPIEFDEAGFRDLFGPGSITASEWSDKAGEFLPSADLELVIAICGTERDVTLKAYSMAGHRVLEELKK